MRMTSSSTIDAYAPIRGATAITADDLGSTPELWEFESWSTTRQMASIGLTASLSRPHKYPAELSSRWVPKIVCASVGCEPVCF